MTGKPIPRLYANAEVREKNIASLQLVSPPGTVYFAWFGERGNLGKRQKFGGEYDQEITDPMEADNEVFISAMPMREGADHNEMMLEFFDWLTDMRVKFIDHLVENITSYDLLADKFRVLVDKGDTETLTEMLSQTCPPVIKFPKDAFGQPKTMEPFLNYRQRLYARVPAERALSALKYCPMDHQMAEKGALRRYIPLWDSAGNEVPIEKASVMRGDIVSVTSVMSCQVYEVAGNVGCVLRRDMRGVVLLRQSTGRGFGQIRSSPFGNCAIAGGTVFE